MSSENNGGFGFGCLFGVVLVVLVAYLVLNTDNPVRDAARKKAFEMSVDHLKAVIFGK